MPKLVRDNTEAVVRPLGVSGKWYSAGKDELLPALKRKLVEEALEFAESGDPAELWDVSDVLETLFDLVDPLLGSVDAHVEKLAKYGGFNNGIMWDAMP